MARERARKRTVVGTVVSDRMDKTISVREDRLVKHPMYGKYIRRASIYKAHDENNDAHEGDQVEILESRPMSKTKHWRLARVLRRAGARHVDTDEADRAGITPSRRRDEEEASS